MNAYHIAEELSAAHGCIDMLKRAAWPAERAEAELHQSNLRALCGQLLTDNSFDTMQAARTIAEAACCIGDTIRPSRPCLARAETDAHAERLHDLARQLAGQRVGELYDDDAGLDEVRDWCAAYMAATHLIHSGIFSADEVRSSQAPHLSGTQAAGLSMLNAHEQSEALRAWDTPPPLPRDPDEVFSVHTLVIDERAAA